jgi:hypothetical protein
MWRPQRAQLEAEKKQHAVDIDALARDRAVLVAAQETHEAALAGLARLRDVLNARAA